MQNDLEMFLICPLRHLRWMGYHKVYITYERHILLHSPEQILQCSPVTETFFHHWDIGIFLIILLPSRIIAINVCDYYIH